MLVVVYDEGDSLICCELDRGIPLGTWWPKIRFLEQYELLAEGIWDGDKCLVIDRVYQLNGRTLELIK